MTFILTAAEFFLEYFSYVIFIVCLGVFYEMLLIDKSKPYTIKNFAVFILRAIIFITAFFAFAVIFVYLRSFLLDFWEYLFN